MADFTIKIGDTAPNIKARLKSKDGTTVTLTGATVVFSMRHAQTRVVTHSNRSANILEATPPTEPDDPNVDYDWETVVPSIPGPYEAEFEVTYSGGLIQTFPDSGFIDIQVEGEVA